MNKKLQKHIAKSKRKRHKHVEFEFKFMLPLFILQIISMNLYMSTSAIIPDSVNARFLLILICCLQVFIIMFLAIYQKTTTAYSIFSLSLFGGFILFINRSDVGHYIKTGSREPAFIRLDTNPPRAPSGYSTGRSW